MLRSTPPQIDPGCEAVGDVQTQLSGEPGLSEVQPTWTLLRSAADALTAVCGQLRLLALPASSTAAVRDAQQRWRDGLARELDTACDQLHAAAASLGRSPPSC
jgi:hypothetical protein